MFHIKPKKNDDQFNCNLYALICIVIVMSEYSTSITFNFLLFRPLSVIARLIRIPLNIVLFLVFVVNSKGFVKAKQTSLIHAFIQ